MPASSKRTTRIILPTQESNPDAIRAFMRNCMVPILANEFLRLRNASPSDSMTAVNDKRTFEPLGKEDGN